MLIILIIVIFVVLIGISVKFYLAASSREFQVETTNQNIDNYDLIRTQWWSKNRLKYNVWLIIAGFTAFVSYAFLGEILIAPYDNGFEVTLFTTFFQSIGYLFMMLVANLFYSIGLFVDKQNNKDNSEKFRQRLFNLGFWFSVVMPFLIPILIVVEYFIRFAGHK